MKKIALLLSVVMLLAVLVIPAAADDTKTISFEAHAGDADYLVADQSTTTWRPDLGGSSDGYYALANGEQLVYKFTLDGAASSAKIAMPALGVYEIWAGSTIDGAKKVYTSASLDSFKDAYCGNSDNWGTQGLAASEYTTVFEPLLDEIDLTSALDGTTLYVILKCTSDIPSGIYTGIWDSTGASASVKYVNRRWNLANNFPKDGGVDGARTKSDKAAGEKYSDGLVTLTYTVASAPAGDPVVVNMLDFDEQYFGSLDSEGHKDGKACASFTFKETSGVEVFQKSFDPIDLSACDFVEFWFYISDSSKVDSFSGAQIELTSGGTCDSEELTYNISMSKYIVGDPVDGWNLVRLDLHGADANSGCDLSRVNFFRMYTLNGSDFAGVTLKWDMMYAYSEGAEVPAPTLYTEPVDPGDDDPTTPGDDPIPGEDPSPFTFDAVSSVAVAAVAALGIVLVASKKRH